VGRISGPCSAAHQDLCLPYVSDWSSAFQERLDVRPGAKIRGNGRLRPGTLSGGRRRSPTLAVTPAPGTPADGELRAGGCQGRERTRREPGEGSTTFAAAHAYPGLRRPGAPSDGVWPTRSLPSLCRAMAGPGQRRRLRSPSWPPPGLAAGAGPWSRCARGRSCLIALATGRRWPEYGCTAIRRRDPLGGPGGWPRNRGSRRPGYPHRHSRPRRGGAAGHRHLTGCCAQPAAAGRARGGGPHAYGMLAVLVTRARSPRSACTRRPWSRRVSVTR